jgi:ABC-type transport system involved in multi-copper enzyme maturation permease subunit
MTPTNINANNVVPSSITQVGITLKYTLLDYVRSRRFFILLAITAMAGILLTGVIGYYRPESFLGSPLAFYSSWWSNSIPLVVVLSGIFFGGDAISSEFQNKTGYFGIPNPVSRTSIYFGKWLAAFTAATSILALFTAVTLGNGIYYFGLNVPVEFLESVLFSWLFLAAVVGVSFCSSSLFKSSSMSILVSAILMLFAFSMVQTVVTLLVQIEPWFILTYGADIIGNIFTIPYPPHVTVLGTANETMTLYQSTVPEGIAIMALYLAVTTLVGLVMFRRKEFN